MTKEWKAGDRSWQLKYGFKDVDQGYKFCEEEFASEAEALERAEAVLRGTTVEQVSIVKWSHQANMPGCLPAVRAYSLSLSNYALVDDAMVEKPIDIHGRSY